ncbi:type II pantothenate kinase [Paenibacillus eucommiae]|uniref:Type II pantothenate kinase n=2 Tax=Paenibacillus eucommiae TaxID=1355755 RepID=A0ABS4ISS8_9BACL|nr:type II pantothenate kinase [Paenibacillus eucommiae]
MDDQDTLQFRKFDSRQIEAAAAWINECFYDATICVTGGKATLLQPLLKHKACTLVEFEATCQGIKFLLNIEGVDLDSFVLTNVGTGTSIHFIDSDRHSRIGGTGVGGGTMMGLSLLLADIDEYDQIVHMAGHGERNTIDLKVSHIYEGSESPISGNLTASNFGNIHKLRSSAGKKEDLLLSVMGLVGETVATTSVLAAGQHAITNVVYIGSSFIHNEILKKVVATYTIFRGANPIFVQNGEFSGAVGALMSLSAV